MTARDLILAGCKRDLKAALATLEAVTLAESPATYSDVRAATGAVVREWKEYADALADDGEAGRQELMF